MKWTKEKKDEAFSLIIERIIEGESLRCILKEDREKYPDPLTFYEWLNKEEEKKEQYARACELREEFIFEEMLKIADTQYIGEVTEVSDVSGTKVTRKDMVEHRKLQIETRKWQLGKLRPKKYGNQVDITSDGKQINPTIIVRDSDTAKIVDDLMNGE